MRFPFVGLVVRDRSCVVAAGITIVSMILATVVVVDRQPKDERAVQDDGGEQGGEQVEVGVGRDLSSLLGALEDDAGLAALGSTNAGGTGRRTPGRGAGR